MPKTEIIRQDEIFLSAVMSGDEAKVEEMLQHGAMVNAFNQYGATPLHWAASEDHVEVLKVLLRHGANPNAKACDGCTPLHFACREDSFESASCLLVAGANPCIKTNQQSRAIDLIYDEEDCPGLVAQLKEYMEQFSKEDRLQFKTISSMPDSDDTEPACVGVCNTSTSPTRVSFSGDSDDITKGVSSISFSDDADGCIMFGYDGDCTNDDAEDKKVEVVRDEESYDRVVRSDGRVEMAIG